METKTQKVSVVVPVYQAEKFLGKCIESVQRQTYAELEIILVDDGSTDQSLKLCRQYQRSDGRIKVFHQENKGVSAARNKGIKEAEGEYILFVDADDIIDPDMVAYMMDSMIIYGVEIVICGYDYVYNNSVVTELPPMKEGLITKEELKKYFWEMYDRGIWHNIGTKLYAKSLIDKKGLYFEERKQVYEDIQFCLDAIKQSENIYICKKNFYKYMTQNNPDSIQKRYRYNYKYSLQKLFEIIKELGIERNKDFYLRFMDNILLALKNEMMNPGNHFIGKIKECKQICQLSEVRSSRDYISCKDVRKVKYIFYELMWNKQYVLLGIMVKLWERFLEWCIKRK